MDGISTTGPSNWTFLVSTAFPCDQITDGLENYKPNSIWRTTVLGCKVLDLLQHMYHFQMTYVNETMMNVTHITPDFYARPRSLSPFLLENYTPMQSIIDRRYGFLVRPSSQPVTVHAFYTLPFTKAAWYLLVAMGFFIFMPLLYILGRWEKRVTSSEQEYSLMYAVVLVIGAAYQHIPPVNPILPSRRLAFFIICIHTWMIYSYYSSNLLSHLVNEKKKDTTLVDLIQCDYKFIALDGQQLMIQMPWYAKDYLNRFPLIKQMKKKVANMELVDVATGLTALRSSNVAFFSDYATIYPFARQYLDNKAICDIVEINLFTNIKEYIYTSNTFPLKQQFKVGMLRIIESGLLKRIKKGHIYSKPNCQAVSEPFAGMQHITGLLILLGCAYALSAILLLIERIVYERNKVWPYVN